MMEVIASFGNAGKLMIGHCAAAMMFENAGLGAGRRVAVHPYAKGALKSAVGTDEASVVDGNFFTAQTENTIHTMMPRVIEALK